jgi:hypothetical protein
MPLESTIVEAIIRELKARKAWYVKYHGHRAGRAGVPDILCCYRGLFIAFEVKQPGKKQTRLQVLEEEKIREAGGISVVVTSRAEATAKLDEVDALLAA